MVVITTTLPTHLLGALLCPFGTLVEEEEGGVVITTASPPLQKGAKRT